MRVVCPKCRAEYEMEPKSVCKCSCGMELAVDEKGNIQASASPVASGGAGRNTTLIVAVVAAVLITVAVLAAIVVIVLNAVDSSSSSSGTSSGSSRSGGSDGGSFAGGAVTTVRLPNGATMELVKVEAGSFMMGARDGSNEYDEREHRVTLSRDFYIGKTEVTQAQWKAVMGNNLSSCKDDDRPVEWVSWNDAMDFCKKLNEQGKAPQGWKFTLPTEAQWEYAARGGKNGRDYNYRFSGSNDLDEVAWYRGNSGGRTQRVAQRKANELGLYDMCGNVGEWCLDRYEDEESFDGYSNWPRVIRGGGWNDRPQGCRSANRHRLSPYEGSPDLGFRIALVRAE